MWNKICKSKATPLEETEHWQWQNILNKIKSITQTYLWAPRIGGIPVVVSYFLAFSYFFHCKQAQMWLSIIINFLHFTVGTCVIVIHKSSKRLILFWSINAASKMHLMKIQPGLPSKTKVNNKQITHHQHSPFHENSNKKFFRVSPHFFSGFLSLSGKVLPRYSTTNVEGAMALRVKTPLSRAKINMKTLVQCNTGWSTTAGGNCHDHHSFALSKRVHFQFKGHISSWQANNTFSLHIHPAKKGIIHKP